MPQVFEAAGHSIELHDDHYPQDMEDIAWMPLVGEKGWIVVTNDMAIAKRHPMELKTLYECNLAAFILTNMSLSGPDKAAAFTKAMRKIERLARSEKRPFIATVTSSGEVKLFTRKPLV